MYMSLQLQNHIGLKVLSSWGVDKKISKFPSWTGLQKNRAQLQKINFPIHTRASIYTFLSCTLVVAC